MSVQPTPRDRTSERYRALPSVHELIEQVLGQLDTPEPPRSVVASAARQAIAAHRSELAADVDDPAPTMDSLVEQTIALVKTQLRPPLGPVINATGILLHTGLGRAPMAASAVDALRDVAGGYAPVELDMDSGRRGSRSAIVSGLLCELTGAEAATVVNNNAAALMLTLASIAKGQGVIVSRGELIEIGGSFRLPDVIEAGGAVLREVGTTNKTGLEDYRRAIDESAAAILKVHPSNYRIEGFAQSVGIEELVGLGRSAGLPVIHDIGSGLLAPGIHEAIPSDEPDATSSIAAGADVVLFSGDKLLGGPQAGIAVGRRSMIERLDRHPMKRALRVDKLTLAALGTTLQLYRDPERAAREIPLLALLDVPLSVLEDRARAMAAALGEMAAVECAELRHLKAYIGGGSVPAQSIDSAGIELRASGMAEEELARRLRMGDPPVVARVGGGSVWIDLRTVPAEQVSQLVRALQSALQSAPT